MYLLDTNIVALFDARRREKARLFAEWMRRNDQLLFLSVVTLIKIEAGILKLMREGKDKRAGEIAALRDGLISDFSQRLLPIDAVVAIAVARLSEAARPMVIELKDLIPDLVEGNSCGGLQQGAWPGAWVQVTGTWYYDRRNSEDARPHRAHAKPPALCAGWSSRT